MFEILFSALINFSTNIPETTEQVAAASSVRIEEYVRPSYIDTSWECKKHTYIHLCLPAVMQLEETEAGFSVNDSGKTIFSVTKIQASKIDFVANPAYTPCALSGYGCFMKKRESGEEDYYLIVNNDTFLQLTFTESNWRSNEDVGKVVMSIAWAVTPSEQDDIRQVQNQI